MDTEGTPLVITADDGAADDGAADASPAKAPSSRGDARLLGLGFLFVFSAYGAAQNLQSSVNSEGDLGTTSLGILYTGFTAFSLVAPLAVSAMGSKQALLIGTTGYVLFTAANLWPSWYTMVPASLYLGFTASIIWVGQGTYLTSAALSHAKDFKLHEGTVIGSFNGEFWGMFASTQVIGNLISLALLRDGKDGTDITGKNILFSVFLGCMVVGIVLMCLLSKREESREDHLEHSSLWSLLNYVITPLKDIHMILMIPLIAYSGLQQAFVWSVYTKYIVKPVLGISGVGGAMAVYGASDAICSLVAGRLMSGLFSATLILSAGTFLQALVLVWLLFFYSPAAGVIRAVYLLLMGFLWGIGDGVLNTQLSALLGIIFKHNKEAAFAQLKVWQSGAIAVIFFASPHMSLQAMVILMAISLCISFGAFLLLAIGIEKVFASRS